MPLQHVPYVPVRYGTQRYCIKYDADSQLFSFECWNVAVGPFNYGQRCRKRHRVKCWRARKISKEQKYHVRMHEVWSTPVLDRDGNLIFEYGTVLYPASRCGVCTCNNDAPPRTSRTDTIRYSYPPLRILLLEVMTVEDIPSAGGQRGGSVWATSQVQMLRRANITLADV